MQISPLASHDSNSMEQQDSNGRNSEVKPIAKTKSISVKEWSYSTLLTLNKISEVLGALHRTVVMAGKMKTLNFEPPVEQSNSELFQMEERYHRDMRWGPNGPIWGPHGPTLPPHEVPAVPLAKRGPWTTIEVFARVLLAEMINRIIRNLQLRKDPHEWLAHRMLPHQGNTPESREFLMSSDSQEMLDEFSILLDYIGSLREVFGAQIKMHNQNYFELWNQVQELFWQSDPFVIRTAKESVVIGFFSKTLDIVGLSEIDTQSSPQRVSNYFELLTEILKQFETYWGKPEVRGDLATTIVRFREELKYRTYLEKRDTIELGGCMLANPLMLVKIEEWAHQ
jgi:hypothetical protein